MKWFRSAGRGVVGRIRTASCIVKDQNLDGHKLELIAKFSQGELAASSPDEAHLSAAMDWLCAAQDACGGQGVSAVYHIGEGWDVAYPETSGYIIATFEAYAKFSGNSSFLARAEQLGKWEVDVQAPNGGVYSSLTRRHTRVFNTGQVVLGWCALYERTGNETYLKAAIRAAEYLLGIQEDDGSWQTDTHCGARTYHARVDWALLRLAQISGDFRFVDSAIKNLRWVLAQQHPNGWFSNCGFDDSDPITHVIAYTMRGLLESHVTSPEVRNLDLLSSISLAADQLCKAIVNYPVRKIDGMVATSFDQSWRTRDSDSCLTGNAQIAILLFRLGRLTGTRMYIDVANIIVDTLKRTHWIGLPIKELRGALPGSYPIFTGYLRNAYPNWATKFMADALMMRLNDFAEYTISA